MQISLHAGRVVALALIVVAFAACGSGPTTVDASALYVDAQVAPSAVSLLSSSDSALIEVTVRVTNLQNRAIVVELGGPPYKSGQIPAAQTVGIGYGLRVLADAGQVHGGPALWTWGRPTFHFGPLETQSRTFRLVARAAQSTGTDIVPGRYRLVPSFGREEGMELALSVQAP